MDAFRRNANYSQVGEVHLYNVADLTVDRLVALFDMVAVSWQNIRRIYLIQLDQIDRIPDGLFRHFPNLEHSDLEFLRGIKVLPAGSMAFSSDNLEKINYFSSLLQVIEPAAFQGTFI